MRPRMVVWSAIFRMTLELRAVHTVMRGQSLQERSCAPEGLSVLRVVAEKGRFSILTTWGLPIRKSIQLQRELLRPELGSAQMC